MTTALFGLSVVVPVYNGAKSVGALVDALAKIKVQDGLEIILVNDGSPDRSFEVCMALTQRADVTVTLLDHARNYGEHNAVMTGLRHVRGAYVITMDDDLQNPPEEVIRLYDHARLGHYDAVYTYYAKKRHDAWRNWGSRFTNWCADYLLDKPKGLYLSSFRCISRFIADEITRNSGPYPYVDGLIMQVTQRISAIEVKHLPRSEGRSNYTIRRLLRLWLSMFLNFSVMPLRAATFIGLGLSLFGLLGFVYVVLEALFGDLPTGWPSLMAAFLLISGVQLMMLGVIGEYLGRMFLTINARPQAILRGVYRNGQS